MTNDKPSDLPWKPRLRPPLVIIPGVQGRWYVRPALRRSRPHFVCCSRCGERSSACRWIERVRQLRGPSAWRRPTCIGQICGIRSEAWRRCGLRPLTEQTEGLMLVSARTGVPASPAPPVLRPFPRLGPVFLLETPWRLRASSPQRFLSAPLAAALHARSFSSCWQRRCRSPRWPNARS